MTKTETGPPKGNGAKHFDGAIDSLKRIPKGNGTNAMNRIIPEVPAPIAIHPVSWKTISITVEGVTPLLCHRFDEDTKEAIANKGQKKGSAPRKAKDPQAEYEKSLYKNEKGQFVFPGRAFRKAMIMAAPLMGDVKRYSRDRVRFSIHVLETMPLIRSKSGPKLHEAKTVIPSSGNPNLTYRGEFEDWEIDLTLRFDEGTFSRDEVLQLFEKSGVVGIGADRPECDGSHGVFQLKRGKQS